MADDGQNKGSWRRAGRARAPRHVVGGSLAGLLAAHVLAEHAGRVTIVERDRLPQSPEPRPGVPQGRHAHVLLEGGQLALEALLPGFMDELRASGAPRLGQPSDMVGWQNGGWFRRTEPSSYIYTGSRGQIEHLVRERVLANPAITTVTSTEAVGLLGDASRVGACCCARAARAPAPSDRSRKCSEPTWCSTPRDAVRAPRSGCRRSAPSPRRRRPSTRVSPTPPASTTTRATTSAPILSVTTSSPNPSQVCGGGVLPLEDGRDLVICRAYAATNRPRTRRGRGVRGPFPHPFIHDWMREAEPDTPPFGFRQTSNLRRRYDRPGRRPAGFLATGDALCTFNPIYGQGMAVAAMSAVALRGALTHPRRTPTTRHVQQALFEASRQAWDISAGADKKMPGAVGNAVSTRAADRVAGWYLARVQQRYPGDPVVGPAFRSVLTLTSPLTTLFAGKRLARSVLFGPVPATPSEPPMTREPGSG